MNNSFCQIPDKIIFNFDPGALKKGLKGKPVKHRRGPVTVMGYKPCKTTVLKKEDIILECFIVKGKGFDFLGVIYEEKEKGLMALSRQVLSGNQIFLKYYSDDNQQRLSDRHGLHPVHLIYPGGIEENRFISSLPEAQRHHEANQDRLTN